MARICAEGPYLDGAIFGECRQAQRDDATSSWS